jgi:hypothetical protein
MIVVNERGAFYRPPLRAVLPSVALGSDINSQMIFMLQRSRDRGKTVKQGRHNGEPKEAA